MSDDQEYYTAQQIADQLDLTKRRITQLMKNGTIPESEKVPFLFGHYWRTTRRSGDEFIAEYKKNL